MRIHVNVPEQLLEEVDALVGTRRRSQFVAEAVAEKVMHVRLLRSAEIAIGSMAGVDTPGWETSESTAAWVRSLRSADRDRQEALERLRAEVPGDA